MAGQAKVKPTHELRFRLGEDYVTLSGLFTNEAKNGSTYLGISGKSIDAENVTKFVEALKSGAAINGVYVMPVLPPKKDA